MSFYLRRLVVFIMLVVVYFGYHAWSERAEQERARTIRHYALAYAQLRVQAALYDDNDSLLAAKRDSVYEVCDMGPETLDSFVASFTGHEERLALFWGEVKTIADSLIDQAFEQLQANDTVAAPDSEETVAPKY